MREIDWRKEYCLYKKELFNSAEESDFLKMALEGITRYFPFERGFIMAYDAETRIKQGTVGYGFNENDIMLIKEDTRESPAFFMAAMSRRSIFMNEGLVEKSIPLQYLHTFFVGTSLSPIIVQPMITVQNVNGFLVLDLGCHHAVKYDSLLLDILQNIGNELGMLTYEKGAFARFSTEPKSEKTLSPRELQVVQGLAYGLSTHEVADHLKINQLTVRDYCSSIIKKLGAINRAHAVAICFRNGIIN